MKKTQEIIGLPVVSISEAMEVGKVESIIVNADNGTTDYFVINSGYKYLNTRIIAAESVVGIGEFALTIENSSAIYDITTDALAVELIQKDIQVKETTVVTRNGRLVGKTGDYYVDEDGFSKIAGLEFISNASPDKVLFIPGESVVTYGREFIIVSEEIEQYIMETPVEFGSQVKVFEMPRKEIPIREQRIVKSVGIGHAQTGNVARQAQQLIEAIDDKYESLSAQLEDEEKIEAVYEAEQMVEVVNEVQQEMEAEYVPAAEMKQHNSIQHGQANNNNSKHGAETDRQNNGKKHDDRKNYRDNNQKGQKNNNGGQSNKNNNANKSSQNNNVANLFEQKQRQYLKGRIATKTITDNDGEVIISEGSVISEEIIEATKANGKLIELVMNNRS